MNRYFYITDITKALRKRIIGRSFPEGDVNIKFEDLAYVHVLHCDFSCQIKDGEIICNKNIAVDLLDIFYRLFKVRYQIDKICLVDEYGADDLYSMADNNTSAFNYRYISGTNRLSNHSYGRAIDINPLFNPYVFYKEGIQQIQPEEASCYADRSKSFIHKIDHADLCYKLFHEHGFTWGGDWESCKDYQHFEK